MKVIISHDVDHIGGWCHWWKDLYWEKFFVKNMLKGNVGRFLYPFQKTIHNVSTVMDVDERQSIKSTFFVGVANGLGMCYSFAAAQDMVRTIAKRGFDVGVHGIAFDNSQAIDAEFKRFRMCVSDGSFGIRNHYLRGQGNVAMHKWQGQVGYAFDSTDYEIKAPYKVGRMWEFPIGLMDAYLLDSDGKNDIVEVKRKTLDALALGEREGVGYFTVIFHDVYYNEKFYPDHKVWYDWFIDYVARKYENVSFKEAMRELEGENSLH